MTVVPQTWLCMHCSPPKASCCAPNRGAWCGCVSCRGLSFRLGLLVGGRVSPQQPAAGSVGSREGLGPRIRVLQLSNGRRPLELPTPRHGAWSPPVSSLLLCPAPRRWHGSLPSSCLAVRHGEVRAHLPFECELEGASLLHLEGFLGRGGSGRAPCRPYQCEPRRRCCSKECFVPRAE